MLLFVPLQGKVYSDLETLTAVAKTIGPVLFSSALSFGRRVVGAIPSHLCLHGHLCAVYKSETESFGWQGFPWLWGLLAATSHVLAQMFAHAAAIGGRDEVESTDVAGGYMEDQSKPANG